MACCGRPEYLPKIKGGRGVFAGVDEQRDFAALQIEGVLDVELKILDEIDLIGQAFIFEPFCESTAEYRPNGIVAATGIADGEDDKRLGLSLALSKGHSRLSE